MCAGKNVARRPLPRAAAAAPGVDLAGGRQTQRVLAAGRDADDIRRKPADAIKHGALDRRVPAGHAGPSIQCRAHRMDRAPHQNERVRAARGEVRHGTLHELDAPRRDEAHSFTRDARVKLSEDDGSLLSAWSPDSQTRPAGRRSLVSQPSTLSVRSRCSTPVERRRQALCRNQNFTARSC